ncbi:hypothetical protein F5B20DRAFT_581125 [Whalleya microplaca]|nr:hypothetical protein F5B20DRAFT_581125 [Whalleya microplaca]
MDIIMDRITKGVNSMTRNDLIDVVLGLCDGDIINQSKFTQYLSIREQYAEAHQSTRSRPGSAITAINPALAAEWYLPTPCLSPVSDISPPQICPPTTIALPQICPPITAKATTIPPSHICPPTAAAAAPATSTTIVRGTPDRKKITKTKNKAGCSICRNCHQRYSMHGNRRDACHYHVGKPQLNPWAPIWACIGDPMPQNTPAYRQAWPAGFQWDCCGQGLVKIPGVVYGCIVRRHVPVNEDKGPAWVYTPAPSDQANICPCGQ